MGYSLDPARNPLRWWQAIAVFILIVGFWSLAGFGMLLFLSQLPVD